MQKVVSKLSNKLAAWLDEAVELLPNFAVALVVFALAWILGSLASRALRRAMERASHNQEVVSLLISLLRLSIIGVGFFAALRIVGLDGVVTSLLAGVGVVGLALGFAFQDIAANFVSGILLALRRPFQVGDLIETNDFHGTVTEVNLRSTIGMNFTGQVVTMPNKNVLASTIKNFTVSGARRVDVAVGVGYDDDLDEAEKAAHQAVSGLERDTDREVEVLLQEFGDSSIGFSVRLWIDPQKTSYLKTKHEAVRSIRRAFAERGITIPFPIRTLEVSDGMLQQLAKSTGHEPGESTGGAA